MNTASPLLRQSAFAGASLKEFLFSNRTALATFAALARMAFPIYSGPMTSTIEVSKAHLDRADEFLRDAHSEAQSARGRSDSAFEGGYLALLSVLTQAEQEVPEHPCAQVVELGSSRLGVDAAAGLRFLEHRYSPEGSDADSVVAWAEDLRARVQPLVPSQTAAS